MAKKDNFNELINEVSGYNRTVDVSVLRRAYEFAKEVHMGESRLSGDPFIFHPIAVTTHLARIRLDPPTLVAGLLHDTLETGLVTKNDLAREFGLTVANLVDGVTVIKLIKTKSGAEQYQENIRKLLLASARDIRVVLIRLAEKLHNLETLDALNSEEQQFTLSKVTDIYVPLAERLGVHYLKSRLEDLAFSRLQPKIYAQINQFYEQERDERENLIKLLQQEISDLLAQIGIPVEIKGRVKGHYSVYRKYLAKKKPSETMEDFLRRLHDKLALMVLVNSVEDCYRTLGVVHQRWHHVPEEFDDYIANPKPNGYRSIQTAVNALPGERVEIQIKTHAMHEYNEFGPAAHVYYKTKSSQHGSEHKIDEQRVSWLKDLVEWHDEVSGDQDFEEAFKIDVFGDRVFVFTPKGDVKDLPRGSNPIDFAYAVHSDIGNRMMGAKVNDRVVGLNHQLESSDVCEVLTTKKAKYPSQDWINIAHRHYTKKIIRHYLNRKNKHLLES